MAQRVYARLSAAEGRKFAFTVGAAFIVLGALVLWRGKDPAAAVLGALGGVLLLAGLVVPAHLGPVQRGWMGFAYALSEVTTPVFLGVLYFGVIAPSGLVLRLFGHKPITKPKDAPSFWVARERSERLADQMEHQY